MSNASPEPKDRGQRFADVCRELLKLASEGIKERTGSPAIAHEFDLDLATGRTAVEFIVTMDAVRARILGVEHRTSDGRQESRGIVEVNLTGRSFH